MNLEEYTWHCIYCPPQRELLTAHDLSARGFVTIVPAEKRWSDKGKYSNVKYQPVMPRYVFTGFAKPPNWEELRTIIPTVQGYMSFGSGPTVLGLSDVRWLHDLREVLRGAKRAAVVEEVVKIGDKVHIIRGPFTGNSVTVDKVVADRIHAIKEFLGAPRMIKIPLADVVRA